MNKLKLAAALTVASFMMTPMASADDDIFNGPYGSLQVGASVVKMEGSIFSGPIKESDYSLLVGGALGMRTAVGADLPLVIGVEATANYYSADSDYRVGISGLAGVRVGARGLAYARVGYGKLARNAEDLDGMVLGGGFEFKITSDANIRFDYKKLNYKYTDFPDNAINYDGHEVSMGMVFSF